MKTYEITRVLRLKCICGQNSQIDLGPWWQNIAFAIWSSITRNGRFSIPFPEKRKGFVSFLKTCLEAGQLRAVIDREYSLDAVADAFRYVETAQKTGIVVINVTQDDTEQDALCAGTRPWVEQLVGRRHEVWN